MKALFFLFGFLTMRVVLDVLFVAALVLAFVLWTVGHLQLLTAEWVGPCILGPWSRGPVQTSPGCANALGTSAHRVANRDLLPHVHGPKSARAKWQGC